MSSDTLVDGSNVILLFHSGSFSMPTIWRRTNSNCTSNDSCKRWTCSLIQLSKQPITWHGWRRVRVHCNLWSWCDVVSCGRSRMLRRRVVRSEMLSCPPRLWRVVVKSGYSAYGQREPIWTFFSDFRSAARLMFFVFRTDPRSSDRLAQKSPRSWHERERTLSTRTCMTERTALLLCDWPIG